MARAHSIDLPRKGNGPYQLLRGFQDGLVKSFLAALVNPRAAQQARLDLLLLQARGTAFGRAHDLDKVRSLEDWRRAVPLRSHADLLPWLDRVAAGERDVLTREAVTMLLETSGTTGRPKHLPCTRSWARGVSDAQRLWMLALLRDHEGVSRGRALTVVSAAEHARSPGGLPIGSNTGRMHLAQPWYVRWRYPVPYEVFCIDDQDARQYAILRFALQADLSTITTANPSTLLLLVRRMAQWRAELSQDLSDGRLRAGPAAALPAAQRARLERQLRKRPVPTDWRPLSLWPRLSTVNCWKGGSAAYFVERLPEALGGEVPVREVGITASEGYFAVPMGADWGGGVLWTLGHLLEFVGEDGEPRWAWEIEAGERLRLVISTEAGLYRYDMQDEIEVIGRCENTPVVRFIGKSGRFVNATGEKVTEDQVSAAMREAARATGARPVGFTARAHLAEIPFLELALEGLDPALGPALLARFDTALCSLNLEYASKRRSSRLGPPKLCALADGAYARFRRDRVAAGAPEGQVKDPIVALDAAEWGRVVAPDPAHKDRP